MIMAREWKQLDVEIPLKLTENVQSPASWAAVRRIRKTMGKEEKPASSS